VRVLEPRNRFQRLARRADENEFLAHDLELTHGHRNVVPCDPEKRSDADDRLSDELVRADDHVVDGPDDLESIVEYCAAEHLSRSPGPQ
jgi:hypothetical protein